MIELRNEWLTVTVATRGAELQSIRYQGREYLWQGDPAVWKRRAPILFPFVGRLKDDQYRFAGHSYQQSQHGFARDQDFHLVQATADRVTLELTDSPASREHYPFAFRLRVTYRLVGRRVAVEMAVTNPAADQTLLYALGAHPGFRVPLTAAGRFESTQLSLAPAKRYGRIKLVGPAPDLDHQEELDCRQPLALNHQLFDHDALVLATAGQATTVTLTEPESGHGVQVIEPAPAAPYLAVWSSAPHYGDLLCLESWWGLADPLTASGDLTTKAALNRLAPGLTAKHDYQIAVF